MEGADPRLRLACVEFERTLIRDMLTSAGFGRAGNARFEAPDDSDDRLDSSFEETTAQSLFVEALSEALERAGGLGFARKLAERLY